MDNTNFNNSLESNNNYFFFIVPNDTIENLTSSQNNVSETSTQLDISITDITRLIADRAAAISENISNYISQNIEENTINTDHDFTANNAINNEPQDFDSHRYRCESAYGQLPATDGYLSWSGSETGDQPTIHQDVYTLNNDLEDYNDNLNETVNYENISDNIDYHSDVDYNSNEYHYDNNYDGDYEDGYFSDTSSTYSDSSSNSYIFN